MSKKFSVIKADVYMGRLLNSEVLFRVLLYAEKKNKKYWEIH